MICLAANYNFRYLPIPGPLNVILHHQPQLISSARSSTHSKKGGLACLTVAFGRFGWQLSTCTRNNCRSRSRPGLLLLMKRRDCHNRIINYDCLLILAQSWEKDKERGLWRLVEYGGAKVCFAGFRADKPILFSLRDLLGITSFQWDAMPICALQSSANELRLFLGSHALYHRGGAVTTV